MIADTRDQTALDLVRYRTSTEICAKRQDEKGVPREDRDMGPRDGVCSSLGNGGGRAGHLSSENCRPGHAPPARGTPGGDTSRQGSQAGRETYPEIELAVGFSFACGCPNISYFDRFYFYGGGGAAVYNIKSWIGVKAELMGYTTSGGFEKQFTNLKAYFVGNGNLFTYTFGPQAQT